MGRNGYCTKYEIGMNNYLKRVIVVGKRMARLFNELHSEIDF